VRILIVKTSSLGDVVQTFVAHHADVPRNPDPGGFQRVDRFNRAHVSVADNRVEIAGDRKQVLNRTAKYWFDQTQDIVANQVIDVPDPNVTVARELDMLPVEIVVRRYLTGSTETSVWTNYNKGVRSFCGVDLPDGMIKNQKFDGPIITPTTIS